MSWAAVAVGVVSAVGGAYSASQANKRASAASGGLDEAIAYANRNPGAFGEKLDFEAVDYTPLFREDPGYANIAGDTIAGNRKNLPASIALSRDTNKFITEDAKSRINSWYPGFEGQFNQQSQNTASFLRGEIPLEDQDAIRGRSAERQLLGGGAVNRQQTAADLGLSRVDLMNQGAANLTNNANLIGIVDPINRRVTPQSMFVDVGQAISSYIAENQFDAQFAQAERNAELAYAMQPDPQKAGMLNLLGAKGGLQAANPQTNVLGAALVSGVTSGVSAYAGGMGKTNQTSAQAAPVYAQASSYGAPAYASQADQANNFQSFSGTGPYGGSGTYNPYTGGSYAEQGSFSTYVPQSKQTSAWGT